jgi:hypothetical protein
MLREAGMGAARFALRRCTPLITNRPVEKLRRVIVVGVVTVAVVGCGSSSKNSSGSSSSSTVPAQTSTTLPPGTAAYLAVLERANASLGNSRPAVYDACERAYEAATCKRALVTDEANLRGFLTGLHNATIPSAESVKNQTLRRALQRILGEEQAAVMAIDAHDAATAARTVSKASGDADTSLVPALCALDPSLSPPC